MGKKRPDRFELSSPAAAAGVAMVGARARVLDRRLAGLLRQPTGAKSRRAVHEVRVATRRTAVAVDAFATIAAEKHTRGARKALRAIRKACGDARDADVLLEWTKAATAEVVSRDRPALEYLAKRLRSLRRDGGKAVASDIPRRRDKAARRLGKYSASINEREDSRTLAELIATAIQQSADAVLAASAADLDDVDCLHKLRIACKRLRYTVELFVPAIGRKASARVLQPLVEFQDQIGGFTDASMRAGFIEQEIARLAHSSESSGTSSDNSLRSGLRRLLHREQKALKREQLAAIRKWRALETGDLFDDLRRLAFAPARESDGLRTGHAVETIARAVTAQADKVGMTEVPFSPSAGTNGELRTRRGSRSSGAGKRRLAAIDIGTNSIRLIVAEASPDGSYRVLDDEKEITRLGRGLHATGRLDPATQEHSALTIARMRSIAEGYGAAEIRVVATAACREAANAAEFLELVRERSGLEVEVIPAEQEALLAYRSAARAFDLRGVPAAVVDIGGGSLEVIFSAGTGRDDPRGAGLGGGVIERVFSMPLGAVRLTEQFGGPEKSCGRRFDDMLSAVRSRLRKSIGKPPLVPQVIVGTGGTFTTIATMLAQKELGPAASGLFSGAVQGRELRRPEISHLLEYLRKMSVKERTRVPGLPADRADIIVAGLAVIDELLDFVGGNSVFVHEGGIRDGLLLSMVRAQADPGAGREVSPMRSVRRFAKACSYEAAHSNHVTGLALRIFDQLAAQQSALGLDDREIGTRFGERDRLLLEAAAILHDVGYLVNYASHHKHSYHLIVHAELPGLTSREVQVIANVARYHRAAEPKQAHRNYSTLGEADQRLVRSLAAVLRIADGLDRTHMQQVEDLAVRFDGRAAHIDIRAAQEPAVDIWGAARKSRLFERVFGVKVHFEWRRTGAEARQAARSTSPNQAPEQAA